MNRLLSPTVFQYAVFYTLKGGLLLCKMPSFTNRKAAYWKTVDCQAVARLPPMVVLHVVEAPLTGRFHALF